MKKIIFSMLLAIIAVTASAQVKTIDIKGDLRHDFGLGVGVTTDLTDNIEFSPAANFYFGDGTNLQFEADFHYKFDLGDDFTLYPIVGAGLNFSHYKFEDESDTDINFLVNLGCGVQKQLTDNLAGFVECKYQWCGHGGDTYFSLGVKLDL
ncbi:MAG: outer membrane beta-barrel protein [Prevotellaceae bacterium]|nr:outer membrane beta-barrel protein [Prevotellaceae bacterium]